MPLASIRLNAPLERSLYVFYVCPRRYSHRSGAGGRMPVCFWSCCTGRPPAVDAPAAAAQTGQAVFHPGRAPLLHHPHPHHGPFACYLKLRWDWTRSSWGRAVRPGLAEKVLSPREYALWRQAPDPNALFLTLWTLKESTVKYTGDGLRGYPNHLSFDPSAHFGRQ